MKQLLTLSMLLASIAFSTEAKTTANAAAAPQTQIRIIPNRRIPRQIYRNNRRAVRVVTQTRNVRVGRQVYRETYQTRYLPNGTTRTRIISRVRIR